jgi:HEAT repeat protein
MNPRGNPFLGVTLNGSSFHQHQTCYYDCEAMERQDPIKYGGKDVEAAPGLSEFVLSLIQAFLKTGYYRLDHPEAKKARSGLYASLRTFIEGKREISFITAREGGKPDVFIGGILDEPVTIGSLMIKGMAEMFMPKFLEYFERKNLSSFSMKSAISENEFEKFIAIMTDSPLFDRETDVREKLTIDLIKNEVLMVSTIFNVDLVGKGRKLPWRVELSISRLKRDLNMIPLYKSISEDRKSEIRKMVFEDIIRPLKSPKLIKELLANLDLISSDLIGFDTDVFETKIVEHLDGTMLPSVSRELLGDISGIESSFSKLKEVELLVRLEYLKRITKRIGQKLIDFGTVDEELFCDFVKHRVLTIDEIHGSVRSAVACRLSLDNFLASPEKFFEEINEGLSPEDLKGKLDLLLTFLPALFAGGRYGDIRKIHVIFREGGLPLEMRDNAGLIDRISREANTRSGRAGKEETSELLNVLSLIGEPGNFALVEMLDNANRFARRSAIDVLRQKGPEIAPLVLSRIDKKEGWYFLRNALTLLSAHGRGNLEIEELFKRSLRHSEANVRKEAVRGIAAIIGEEAGDLLVPLLKDENGDVRKRVISSLAAIGCVNPEAIGFIVNVLTNKSGEDDTVLDLVLNALAEAPIPRAKEPPLEDALIDLLKDSPVLGFLRRKSDRDLRIAEGAIKALGTLGTAKSVKILRKYASEKNTVLGKAASEALERIEGIKGKG